MKILLKLRRRKLLSIILEKGSPSRTLIEEEIPTPKREIDPQEELMMAFYGFVDGKIPCWEQKFNKESGRWEDWREFFVSVYLLRIQG